MLILLRVSFYLGRCKQTCLFVQHYIYSTLLNIAFSVRGEQEKGKYIQFCSSSSSKFHRPSVSSKSFLIRTASHEKKKLIRTNSIFMQYIKGKKYEGKLKLGRISTTTALHNLQVPDVLLRRIGVNWNEFSPLSYFHSFFTKKVFIFMKREKAITENIQLRMYLETFWNGPRIINVTLIMLQLRVHIGKHEEYGRAWEFKTFHFPLPCYGGNTQGQLPFQTKIEYPLQKKLLLFMKKYITQLTY